MKTLEDVQIAKQICENQIRNALLKLISNNPVSNISVDVEIGIHENYSGDKIINVKPIITIGI